jgi:hypothetical protein
MFARRGASHTIVDVHEIHQSRQILLWKVRDINLSGTSPDLSLLSIAPYPAINTRPPRHSVGVFSAVSRPQNRGKPNARWDENLIARERHGALCQIILDGRSE